MIRPAPAAGSGASLEPVGFPSPAGDYLDAAISLDTCLIEHPAATFFFRARGQGREADGVFDGDLLVVDRALTPSPASLVVAVIGGEFVVRRLRELPVEEVQLWGVVRWSIHRP